MGERQEGWMEGSSGFLNISYCRMGQIVFDGVYNFFVELEERIRKIQGEIIKWK